jgi:hypothetical protein
MRTSAGERYHSPEYAEDLRSRASALTRSLIFVDGVDKALVATDAGR